MSSHPRPHAAGAAAPGARAQSATSAPRLFVDAPLAPGRTVRPEPAQIHYLIRVMRRLDGDAVVLFNGRDGEWLARLARPDRRTCTLSVEARLRAQAAEPDLWLLFAPVKRLRVDYLVQKAAELGASALQPVLTEHTGAARVKLARFRANAAEAAEQSGRLTVPEVHDPVPLGALLAGWSEPRPLFWADESGAGSPAMRAFAEHAGRPAAVLVGPEGGFAAAERTALRAHPAAHAIDLGPRVLRADTAALAALALWQATAGDWARA